MCVHICVHIHIITIKEVMDLRGRGGSKKCWKGGVIGKNDAALMYEILKI